MHQFEFEQSSISEGSKPLKIPLFKTVGLIRELNLYKKFQEAFIDLQKLLLEEKSKEMKKIQILKEKQQHIGEQVEKRLAIKEKKIREMEEQQKKKVQEQCTFQPKTIAKKGEKRSLNQFLQQQNEFTKKVMQKRNTLKKNLELEKNTQTFHPKINNKNGEGKKKDTTVFERLYALKDKENDDDNSQIKSEISQSFHPKIHERSKKLVRNAPIDELLYGDALKRQQKIKKDVANAGMNSQSSKFQKGINLNNEKYVAQKFIKQFSEVIERLGIPSGANTKIDYLVFNQILKATNFVQVEEQNQNNHQRTLIHEAYQMLEKYQVNIKNICVFLLGIIGIYHINPVNFEEGEQISSENQFLIDEIEGRKMQKYFDLFKRNKMHFDNKREVINKTQSYTFHPKINKQSQQMAEKHRNLMLEEANQLLECYPQLEYHVPQDGVISHTDLLVLNNLAKQIKLQKKKEESESRQLQQCTFKPTTISNSTNQSIKNSKMSHLEGSLGQKKSFELYNNFRNIQSKKESLKVSRQYEDKIFQECTFAPNLNHPKIVTDTSKFNTKQVQETLYRMKKGRQQHQEKNKFLQRGQRSFKKQKQLALQKKRLEEKRKTFQDQIPTLILDVNLGEKMDQIILFKGDENRLSQVARNFAQKHSLEIEDEQKLTELLKIELQNVLMKIDEDQQSDQFEQYN